MVPWNAQDYFSSATIHFTKFSPQSHSSNTKTVIFLQPQYPSSKDASYQPPVPNDVSPGTTHHIQRAQNAKISLGSPTVRICPTLRASVLAPKGTPVHLRPRSNNGAPFHKCVPVRLALGPPLISHLSLSRVLLRHLAFATRQLPARYLTYLWVKGQAKVGPRAPGFGSSGFFLVGPSWDGIGGKGLVGWLGRMAARVRWRISYGLCGMRMLDVITGVWVRDDGDQLQ